MIIVIVGSIVHFVTEEGTHLPALVVKVWPENVLNLSVFIDHSEYTGDAVYPVTSVPYGEGFSPGTWHLPETVEL
jgi:hypothetical protein